MAAKFDWKKHKGYVIAGVAIVAGIYIWYNSKSSSVGFDGWNNVGGSKGGGGGTGVTANNANANTSVATTMAVNATGGSGAKNYVPTGGDGNSYHHGYGGGIVDNVIIEEPYLQPYVYSEMNPMYCNSWAEQWNGLYMRLTVIPPMQANAKNPLAVSLVNDLNKLTYTMKANGCGMINPIITITNTAIIFN